MSDSRAANDVLANAAWETIGWFGVDAGIVGFADVSFESVPADLRRFGRESRAGVSDIEGVQVAWYDVGDDGPVEVNVVRDLDGALIAARLKLLDDIDEYDGTWEEVGDFEAPSGSAIGCDPRCTSEGHSTPIEGLAGPYSFQIFQAFDDPNEAFGCRIVRKPF